MLVNQCCTSQFSCAEGPTTLHLHDPLFSAAGRALAHGKPLQLSLADGSAAAVVAAWTDVQVMAVHAPAVSHLLCVPFGCSNASAAGSTGHSHPHGSGSGALLLGFPSPPALEPPRKAMLAALAACMPAPMARLSADTLSFVNFACGSQQQCSCCCGVDEEEEEDDGVPSSPCREDDHSAGGRNNGAGPSQALRVPGALAAGGGGAPGSSTRWWEEESEEGGKLSLKARAAAAGSAAAAASLPRASPAAPALRFSKALLAAAAGGGEEFTAQSSLTLAFRSSLMEGEFARWVSQYHVKVRGTQPQPSVCRCRDALRALTRASLRPKPQTPQPHPPPTHPTHSPHPPPHPIPRTHALPPTPATPALMSLPRLCRSTCCSRCCWWWRWPR